MLYPVQPDCGAFSGRTQQQGPVRRTLVYLSTLKRVTYLEEDITGVEMTPQQHTLESDDVSEDEDSDKEFRLCPRLDLDDRTGCSLFWRILTVVFCLPLSYPCYLTRKTR